MKASGFNVPHAVACGLGVLIVVQLCAFARVWNALRTGNPQLAATNASHPRKSYERLATEIIDRHLFGAPPRPAEDSPSAAVTTTYNLKGVIALGSSGQGFAIIAGSDGKSKLYRTGQSLSPQVSLRRVARDYVLLLDDAKLERLALPRGGLAALLAGSAGHAARGTTDAAAPLTADTLATLAALGLNVIQDGAGSIAGISGQGSPSWHRSGLLPSDVIVAIDRTPVGQVLTTPMAIDNASVAAVTTLTVLRDGTQMDIEALPEPAHATRRPRPRS